MQESSRRQDSLLNQHEGRCSIRVRWFMGRLERSGEQRMAAYLLDHHGRAERVCGGRPYPDADNSAGRASRCLVIREAGKEILVPFPAERMKRGRSVVV